jgi:hypothetical protein
MPGGCVLFSVADFEQHQRKLADFLFNFKDTGVTGGTIISEIK